MSRRLTTILSLGTPRRGTGRETIGTPDRCGVERDGRRWWVVGWTDRFRRGRTGPRTAGGRAAGREDEAHLRRWAAEHPGVEGFVEPATAVTGTTLLLVDTDGAWTRRRVDSPAAARKLARSLRMPVYDAQIVGYPQRMRDHDARERILRARERREGLG